MRKQLVILVITTAILILSACGQSEQAIQRAIEQTQSAQPSATPEPSPTTAPTKIPLKELNLSEIFFLEGELPSGYLRGKVTDEPLPIMEKSSVKPINKLIQELGLSEKHEISGNDGGKASIYLYETSEIAKEVFEDIVFKSPPVVLSTSETNYAFGEDAYGLQTEIFELYIILFLRCNAIVAIQVNTTDGYYGIQDYLKNLDNRLIYLVCGNE